MLNKELKPNIAASLDLSAGGVRAMIGQFSEHGLLKLLGVSRINCNGICYGEIVDSKETSHAIRLSLREAETEAGVKAPPVRVGIHGDYIAKDAIRQESKHGLRMRPSVSAGREMLHCCPRTDNEGRKELLTVSVNRTAMDEFIHCLQQAGVAFEDVVWAPLAISALAPKDQTGENDCLIIDIGLEYTCAILVRQGLPYDLFVIPGGGEEITNRLSVAFGVSYHDAENIKVLEGWALPKMSKQYDPIQVAFTPMKPVQVIYSIQVARIIETAITELLHKVANALEEANYDMFISHVYLSGGTAALRGLPELVAATFNVPASCGLPIELGCGLELSNPYSLITNMGLLYSMQHPAYRGYTLPKKRTPNWRRPWQGVQRFFRSSFIMEYRPARFWEV